MKWRAEMILEMRRVWLLATQFANVAFMYMRWGRVCPLYLVFWKCILEGFHTPAKCFCCEVYHPENPGVKEYVFIVLWPPGTLSHCTASRRRASIWGMGASVSCRSQSRTFDKCLFWATQQNKTKRHKQWPCLQATDKDSLANYFCAWTVGRKSTCHLALKPDQGSLKITITTQKELMNAVVQIFSVDSERSRG